MTQWIETIDGKSYWFMRFTADEMILLRKYHETISRMTNIDFSGCFNEPSQN